MSDITLLDLTYNGRYRGRLYYYMGNFFYPVDLPGDLPGKVLGAIRRFMKENRAMVEADRAKPDYKTLLELADIPPPLDSGESSV